MEVFVEESTDPTVFAQSLKRIVREIDLLDLGQVQDGAEFSAYEKIMTETYLLK
jgi:hypothetical protein